MEALRLLDAQSVAPTTFVLREPSLDDVFLALTGKRTDVAEADGDATAGDTGKGRGRGRKGACRINDRRCAMTTTASSAAMAAVAAATPSPAEGGPIGWAVADTLTITWRNLLACTACRSSSVFSTVQPIMFVLLFRYVFGGAIHAPGGGPYVNYLMPGIYVQSVAFGSISTAVAACPRISRRGSSSGSGLCPWPGRRFSPGGRRPTWCATSSW